MVGVERIKAKVVMDRPIFIGQAILDMSKKLMYDFHYKYIKPKYGRNVKLMYMDTDSFVYHITGSDVYKDMEADRER